MTGKIYPFYYKTQWKTEPFILTGYGWSHLIANGSGPLDITDNTFENLHRDGPALGNGNAAGVVFFTPAPYSGTVNVSSNEFDNSDAGVRTLPGGYLAHNQADGSNPGADFVRVAMVQDQEITAEALHRIVAVLD